jgi:predicted polyphosphate/ATP-dependent NAD kinase
MMIPDEILVRFRTTGDLYKRRIVSVDDIVGKSIITGKGSNEMDSDVGDFLLENSMEDSMVVLESNESGEWGDMAIRFEDREVAEEFEDLVREKGGRLRLTASDVSNWFSYEAE